MYTASVGSAAKNAPAIRSAKSCPSSELPSPAGINTTGAAGLDSVETITSVKEIVPDLGELID